MGEAALAYSDMKLDELAVALAPAIADSAVFDGWTDKARDAAADLEGVDRDVARLAYPGGAMDMIEAFAASVDHAMAAALPAEVLQQMGFTQRIRALLMFRLEHVSERREALRRAVAVMSMPQNAARSAQLAWRTADLMWRMAGDTATDFNHYTKRAILASLYAATITVFIDDESEGQADTYAFMDRRLEDVGKFNTFKAQLLGQDRDRFSITRFLGRLRYPTR